MDKPFLLVLIFVGLSCGFPFQEKLEYLRQLVRRDTYKVWNFENYPNPKMQFAECNRRNPSMVCDPDSILTEEQANNLDFIISQIKNETVCVCNDCSQPNSGISVALAVMRHMYHDYQSELSNSSDDLYVKAEEFTKGLSKKWEFGQCNDYIIILLATDEKQSFIESGKIVHGVLSEQKIDEIFEQIKDHFETGAYYQGLESLVKSIYDNIKVILKAPTKSEDETNESNVGLTVGLVVGFIALAALFAVGVLTIRKRQQRGDNFMFDSHKTSAKKESTKSNIVKVPVVFPDAVYQPCSIEDPAGNFKKGSDEEINFEERKSDFKESNSPTREQIADVHNGHMRHELSAVEEEDSKDILEAIDVDDPDEKIVFAQTHPPKPARRNELRPRV